MALYQSPNSMPLQQVWNRVASSLLGEGKSQAVWTTLHTFAPNALNNEIYPCTSLTQGKDLHTNVPIPTLHTSLTSALSHYVQDFWFMLFSSKTLHLVIQFVELFKCAVAFYVKLSYHYHMICILVFTSVLLTMLGIVFFNKLSNYVRIHYYSSISDSATCNLCAQAYACGCVIAH